MKKRIARNSKFSHVEAMPITPDRPFADGYFTWDKQRHGWQWISPTRPIPTLHFKSIAPATKN